MKRSMEMPAALAAAIVGGTIGTMGDVLGAVVGSVVGAISGGLAAHVIERRRQALELESVADETWAAMIEPPRADEAAWHAREHPRTHVHYEYPPTFATGSMLLRPSF